MKLFLVFTCLGYEAGIGFLDFNESFDDREQAIALLRTGEWGAVFDSKTGEQYTCMERGDCPIQWDKLVNIEGGINEKL